MTSFSFRGALRAFETHPRQALTLLFVVFAAGMTWWHLRSYVFDDAYITYRYAQNASSGHGLVFNVGERVFGTSSPLQAVSLTLAGALGLDIAATGGVLYGLAWGACALLGAAALRTAGSPSAAILFAGWCFAGLGGLTSYWGLETALYTSLLLGSVALARRSHDGWAGAVAGLAVLARYDGAVGALVLAALLAWQRRRFPWRYALAGVAVTVPWLVFAQLYFGSFLPNTLSAKAQSVGALEYMGAVLAHHVRTASPMSTLGLRPFHPPFYAGLFAFLIAGGVFLGLRETLRRNPFALHYGLTAVLLWVAYGQIGPPTQHHWHMAPAAILAGLFCVQCWGQALRPRPWYPVAALLVLVVGAGLLPGSLDRRAGAMLDNDVYRNREGAYREMAEWLHAKNLTHLRVMTAEPGYLAYLAGNPVIDLAGLVTQDGLYFHGPAERITTLNRSVDELRPDLVVLDPGTAPNSEVPGYATVHYSFASRLLAMRRDLFENHLARLGPDSAVSAAWPSADEADDWRLRRITAASDLEELRREGAFLPRPVPVQVADERIPAFTTRNERSPWSGMETPEFVIDFDRLEIDFQGTHRTLTLAQLVIDGLVVLEAGGQAGWANGGFTEIQSLGWPTEWLRGHRARIRFVDIGPSGHRVMFSRVEAFVDAHATWQGFEREERLEEGGWSRPVEIAEANPARRAAWRDLALETGYPVRATGSALSTLGTPGLVVTDSPPFPLPRSLSLIALDRCPQRCAVELRVGDRTVRRLAFSGSNKLIAETWGLRRLEGKPAVLRLIDAAGEPEQGFAVDDILFRGEARPVGMSPP